MKKLSDPHKKKLFIGLILITIAFASVLGIFYCMVNAQRVKSQEVDTLKEQVISLSAERDAMKRLTGTLEQKIGSSLDLKRVLEEANQVYGDTERNRREGHLWIDRESATFVVTLGALNGLIPGSRLVIYDGGDKIGVVTVETPLDIISYVQPIEKTLLQFRNDYYRVVLEE